MVWQENLHWGSIDRRRERRQAKRGPLLDPLIGRRYGATMKRLGVAVGLLLLVPLSGVFGLGSADSPFILVPNVRLWGADMTIGYRGIRPFPAVETILWAHVGGGWEGHSLYRDFSLDSPVGQALGADDERADYNKLTLDWQVGLAQGIVWSPSLERNLLEAVFLSKWRLDAHRQNADGTSALLASALPDAAGLFMSSVLAALHFDGIRTESRRQTKDGVDAEVSAEWAPRGLFGSPAEFVRLNAHVAGLVTLAQAAHVALVAGGRLEADLLLAPSGDLTTIPVWARSTLGGVNPDGFGGQSGLGGAVRGLAGERFDGTLKVVNNLELRVLFPEIFPVAIFPGLIFFVDVGTSDWRRLDRAPVLPGDLVVSAGAGLDLRALVADLVLYGSWCFTPEEARGFRVDFRFSTQF